MGWRRRLLLLWLWPLQAHGARLVLPATEDEADWADAVELSGLDAAPGSALLTPGPPWRLTVQRADGTRIAHEVEPPMNPEDREAIVILAASLLQPSRLNTSLPVLPVLPVLPAPPAEADAKPRPATAQKPIAPPTPPPEPVAPPPPPPPAPPPPQVEAQTPQLDVSVAVGVAASQARDHGAGIGGAVHATVASEGPLFGEIGARWLAIPQLALDRPQRDMRDTSLWVGLGYRLHPRAPAPRLGLGGAGRVYRFDDSTVGEVNVPWVDLGFHYDIGQPLLGARLTCAARRDLRRVVLSNSQEIEGAVSPWAAHISFAIRRGRIGATSELR